MRNDVAVLKTKKAGTKDADGYRSGTTYKDTTILCEVKTASRAEAYEALRSGIKVQMVATIDTGDYDLACETVDGKKYRPSLLVFDSTTYNITRVYRRGLGVMELSLSEVE